MTAQRPPARSEQLALDEARRLLDRQVAVLDSYRDRATTVAGAGAAVTAFLGYKTIADASGGWTLVAVVCYLASAGLSLFSVLPRWPKQAPDTPEPAAGEASQLGWKYAEKPAFVLATGMDEQALALRLGEYYESNRASLRRTGGRVRLAAIFLALEIAFWLIGLYTS